MEEKRKSKLIGFEGKKILSLNKFFMRNVLLGLMFAFFLFLLTVGLLVFTVIITKIDEAVKITIISMIATFILTTSKTLIDRTIEVVTYAVRLLGEEQRGFNKKIGVEMAEIDFGEEFNDEKD